MAEQQTTRIDLIRHGEPSGGDVFRGRVNPPLTDLGRWQFRERVRRHACRMGLKACV